MPFLFLLTLLLSSFAHAQNTHGTSAFGVLAYPATFSQFNYTTPASTPRGGTIIWGTVGSFNSLNPFIIRGTPLPIMSLLCFARLLTESYDEIGSHYSYVAESVETAADYTWVKFHLRADATFSDNTPITAHDVMFSFHMACNNNPMQKEYYRNVAKVEALDNHTIIFHCPKNVSREIAGILGQLAILPKAFFTNRDAGAPLAQAIPSSGPYVVESFEMGTFVQLKRRADWWGSNIPSQAGKYNIETLRVQLFHDSTVLLQALLAGDIDLCFENRIKTWEESYKGAPFDQGIVCSSELPHQDCSPTSGFFFNTRRPFFSDQRVRRAINLMINGPWLNTNLYENRYKRNQSYYPNSILAHQGLPEGEEKETLEPYRAQLPESLWTNAPLGKEAPYNADTRRRQALALLMEAGYTLDQDVLKKDGQPCSFEILLSSPLFEKLALHVQNVLKPLGIKVSVRTIDRVVYQEKLEQLEFDMVAEAIAQSMLPGNEQMSYWGSTSANQPGTRNYAGIQSPVVDALCNKLLAATNYKDLCAYVHALDRVLITGDYMIPGWHFDRVLVGHKPRLRWLTPHCPQQTARCLIETMWVDDTVQPKLTGKPSFWQRAKAFLSFK